ncbi:GNAT family N-acetyltransferase [Niastella caeni]|uniref:Aminoglycoside N(6')-acetyltransferase type 1 n=1 Tax=Niastella caeni TaxID=2569763 RepID=A0A4S8I1H7_9BACT|nr:aminoglycoside 6'-N-acetyltransferase [Niastella caeni]THU40354.1 GNAT family N-acetyltransferase [Niastella caeni]
MTVELISTSNIKALAQLMLELWPDSSFDEELESCIIILNNDNDVCYLIKDKETYIAFIHLTVRLDYVEGANSSPVAYIEGLYVKENWRHLGIGKKMINLGTEWGRQKGCRQLASDTELNNVTSIEFHKRMGFFEANRIVCFIMDL